MGQSGRETQWDTQGDQRPGGTIKKTRPDGTVKEKDLMGQSKRDQMGQRETRWETERPRDLVGQSGGDEMRQWVGQPEARWDNRGEARWDRIN